MEKDPKSKLPSYSPLYVLLVVAFLSFAAVVVFSVLYFEGGNIPNKPFHYTFEILSRKYITELTPHLTGISVLGVVAFTGCLASFIYFLVSLCLPPDQSPVLVIPTLTPKMFFLLFFVSCASSVMWLFMFDHEQLVLSFVFQFISCVTLWKSIAISLSVVHDNAPIIVFKDKTMLWLVRILVHNGLIFFAAILTGNTVFGFGIALIYQDSYGSGGVLRGGFSIEDGSTLALGGFLCIVLMFIVLELSAYRDYFIYTFTTSLGFVAYFATIIAKLHLTGNIGRNYVITAAALGVCAGWFVIKISSFVTQFQTLKDRDTMPLKQSESSDKTVLVKM